MATDGMLPIDNNPMENTIRPIQPIQPIQPIAIGKKNWLFAGSEQAGQRFDARMPHHRKFLLFASRTPTLIFHGQAALAVQPMLIYPGL